MVSVWIWARAALLDFRSVVAGLPRVEGAGAGAGLGAGGAAVAGSEVMRSMSVVPEDSWPGAAMATEEELGLDPANGEAEDRLNLSRVASSCSRRGEREQPDGRRAAICSLLNRRPKSNDPIFIIIIIFKISFQICQISNFTPYNFSPKLSTCLF